MKDGGVGNEDWELIGCVPPRPGAPAAHCRVYLALLPSGPDAVRRLKLLRVRAAMRRTHSRVLRRSRQILSVTYGVVLAEAMRVRLNAERCVHISVRLQARWQGPHNNRFASDS